VLQMYVWALPERSYQWSSSHDCPRLWIRKNAISDLGRSVCKRILSIDNRVLQAGNERWPKVEMKASNEVYCGSQMIPSVSRDINL